MAVDLDGTLLDANGRPHLRDLQALRAAIAAGVHVSIITGRLYSGTRGVSECVGVRGALGCADGSHLVRAADHSTLLHHGLVGDAALLLRDALARARVTTFVFADDAIGHDEGGEPFLRYVSTWSNDIRLARDVFAHDLWTVPQGVTAIVALGPRERIKQGVGELGALSGSVFLATFPVLRSSEPDTWAVLVRAAAGSKGTALRWIADYEGVPIGDTVCVGDWLNDLPMFEAAGRSFAMGQAPDEVKSKATDVLDETVQSGGGVARVIADVFGISGP